MDEGNITQFVVVNVPRRPGHEVPNEFIAEYCSQYPGRAIGLASVHPNDPTAFDDFENSVKNLGLKGLKLSPVYQGFDPGPPRPGASTTWPRTSVSPSCSTWAACTTPRAPLNGETSSPWTKLPEPPETSR